MSGPNDQAMAETTNPISNGVNWAVNQGMDLLGYNTRRRDPSEDNSFYRDNAQYMPGWSMPGSGLPSGAYAQDRATNYVGHPDRDNPDSTNVWDNVRRSLVQQEGARIQERQAAGESGRLSFMDLYGAHVNAYDNSSRDPRTGQDNSHGAGGHNGFIDPASFALAVYGAPALEAIGINSGPITGTSIDMFNDPTDSATGGWLKRMGLAGGEIGAGAAAMATGHPLIGAGLMGLGAFSGAYNTVTALRHGMLGEIGGGIANGARSLWNGAGNLVSGAGSAISNGLGAAGTGIANGARSLWNGASNMAAGAGSAISSGLGAAGRGVSNVVSGAGSMLSRGASAVGGGISNAASGAGRAISNGWHSLFG
jgi:hypothetical protein